MISCNGDPDGTTRTSRIVGSVDFKFAKYPSEEGNEASDFFTTIQGVRCAMPFTIKVASSNKVSSDEINRIAKEVFDEVEDTLSNWNPRSEINKVNNMKVGVEYKMSKMLGEVIHAAKEAVKYTRGGFDPSILPVLEHYKLAASKTPSINESLDGNSGTETSRRVINIWKHLLDQGYSSDSNDLRISRKVQKLMGFSQWSSAFSVKENKISKKHQEARLDLSGIAKGYTIDEISRRLPEPCYVEWGGDVKVSGKHPMERPWKIAITQPKSLNELKKDVMKAKASGQIGPIFTLSEVEESPESRKYLAVLELNDGDAVATSGDSEKVIQKDEKLYSHIINPRFGRLLEINESTLAQAVVVCKGSCMFADVLATAAISTEDPAKARYLLDNFRTNFHHYVNDFLLYARKGPRTIRLSIPGIEPKTIREERLSLHKPARVIVVGSGLAGMSAAIEAADARASVIIIEKEDWTGGNSAKATSGINGWGTTTQANLGVPDEERLFERDTHKSGLGGCTNPSLVRTLSTHSSPAIAWLQQKFNIPLSVVSQLGGHSRKRTHRAPPDSNGNHVPIGYFIMSTMRTAIEQEYSDRIEIRCRSKVTNLLKERDINGIFSVKGVRVECDGDTYEELGDSVVLATGGFSCDQSPTGLLAKYRPDLLGFPTTNGAFAQGQGITLAETVNAELVDMNKIQLHPTGFIDPKDPFNPTKILCPEAVRGSGGVLLNSHGKRFVNELDLRSVVTKSILDNCETYKNGNRNGSHFAWVILSKQAQEVFGLPTLNFYHQKMGLFEKCQTVSDVAKFIGCDTCTLNETLDAYARAKDVGSCDQTGKTVFPTHISSASKDLLIARVTPSIHYTMGGINFNPAAEVQERLIDHFGEARHIRNLYAAGEVTGGVHGSNRLAGNSLLECCVFGRIAGERSATVNQPSEYIFPESSSYKSESSQNWFPLVLREVKNTDEKYGKNTVEVRFNLYGARQRTGLDVGQFVGLRGEFNGETLQGYFSPITRPDDEGVIGILCRVDDKGGPITKLLNYSRPGSIIHLCPLGGLRLKFQEDSILYRGKKIRRIGLLAGGTGIAPMIQIIRAYSGHIRKLNAEGNANLLSKHGLRLIHATEGENDASFLKTLNKVKNNFPEHFNFYLKLDKPPIGWTEGVGYVEPNDIRTQLIYPSDENDLIVICGPPLFEHAMMKVLARLGFQSNQIFSFSEQDGVSAKR